MLSVYTFVTIILFENNEIKERITTIVGRKGETKYE